jgi:hypothetical protein
MVKNQDKRIDKLAANLPAKERALAILDAVRNEDKSTATSLQFSTPMKTYSQPDLEVTNVIDVVENMSLRFDRAFYHLLSGLFAAQVNDDSEKDRTLAMAEKLMGIFALVAGLDMFAEKVGLSTERLLSFSTVMDSEFLEYILLKPEKMHDETLTSAKEHCAMMEGFWNQQARHSPFKVAA